MLTHPFWSGFLNRTGFTADSGAVPCPRRLPTALKVVATCVLLAGCFGGPVPAPGPGPAPSPDPSPSPAPPPSPSPWKPTTFGIGVSAQPPELGPSGWLAQTGVPFGYAYQYLAAGVNTGNGWQTWNDKAQFPLWYARDAAARGALPVFPYYMLRQSIGPCDACGEAEQDLAHLDSPGLMATYYADFAKLMQRLGPGTHDGVDGYGGDAVVHVEPDLSGYAQQAVRNAPSCYGHCTGTGNDPNLLRTSVASSGYAPVAGYPNTWRGFNLALLHLRDLYAPNVKLAFHVSSWTTGRDIGSDTDPALDPVAHGNLAGSFAVASGVGSATTGTSNYDMVFNDVADRDAGYYKYVLNQPNRFWDRLNVTFPNFRRWEEFVGAVTETTGRKMVVWQIPLGNQWSRSVSNSDDHYQDNRAEYFFGHVDELVDVGVVALLFGRGNDGSTSHTDAHGDGVTNPASFCTTDGVSSGQVCNTTASTVTDDDGGYLRQAATTYYAAPVTL